MKKNKITMIIVSLIVLATVIYGFLDGGSPQAARNKRFDDKRIRDIQVIKGWVNSYYNKNKLLPSTAFEALTNNYNSGNLKIPTDPETNSEYQYQVVNGKEYKICTTFSTSTKNNGPQYLSEYSHPIGLHCFTFDGDKY